MKEKLEKIDVRNTTEKLITIYNENKTNWRFSDNGYIILEDTFLVHINNMPNEMTAIKAVSIYINMYKDARLLGINQFVIISEAGFESGCEKLEEYNVRLENSEYIMELEENKKSYIELLAHNRGATKYIKNAFDLNQNKVCIVQPTGTGKSYIVSYVFNYFNGKNKLVLGPNKYVLNQLKETMESKYGDLANTTFMTYKKLMLMKDEELLELNPSIITLDEVHRVGAKKWGSQVKKLLNMYSNCKVIGLTATPIRNLDGGRNMAEELFGDNVYNKTSLESSISRGILPIPKYISALYTIDEVLTSLEDDISKSSRAIDDKEELYKEIRSFKVSWDTANYMPNLLRKYVTDDMGKFIVFCKNKNHLLEVKALICNWFNKAKPNKKILEFVVSTYETNSDENLELFRKHSDKDSIALLFCINKVNEGVHLELETDADLENQCNSMGIRDIKTIDGVIFFRLTASQIIYYQQLGRAMTVSSNKNPLILDLVNNIDSIGNVNFAKTLLNIHDERGLAYKELTGLNFDDSFKENVLMNIIDETKDFKEFLARNNTRLNTSWHDMYNLLLEYKAEYGTCDVPKSNSFKSKYYGLGNWVSYNRTLKVKNMLDENKIELLNGIGFTWDMRMDAWIEMYNYLEAYGDKYGSIFVPYGVEEYAKLRRWMDRQARLYRNGELSLDKIKLLEKLKFNFNKKEEPSFEERVYSLVQYKEKFNTCNVTLSEEYKSLHHWVVRMRKQRRKNLLNNNEIKILNDIGFSWSPKDDQWNEVFNILKNHKEEYGTFKVSSSMSYYSKLLLWLNKQKKLYSENKLNENRLRKFKEIGYSFEN